jgi:hypothetical protein
MGLFLLVTSSMPDPGPIKLAIILVQGTLTAGLKRSGCETDHSPPPSAEIKNAWCYTSTLPNTFSWRGA